MDSFYHNSSVESFMRAWRRGETGKVATNAIPAAVEKLASPIMKHWVPRMKLGTFSLLAEEELARLGPNANLWEQRERPECHPGDPMFHDRQCQLPDGSPHAIPRDLARSTPPASAHDTPH